jgi:hypothetical protein
MLADSVTAEVTAMPRIRALVIVALLVTGTGLAVVLLPPRPFLSLLGASDMQAQPSHEDVDRASSPQAAGPFPENDPALVREITEWKKGSPPPPRLLQFPDGPPQFSRMCDMRAFGDAVDDYISRIGDADLLEALLFNPQADQRCIRASFGRLIEVRGVPAVRAMLAERRKSHPRDLGNAERAMLAQLLTSPYARARAVSIEKSAVEPNRAEKVLVALAADLAAGVPWERAYMAAANVLFDEERSRKEAGGWRTFLCYRYDGLISPLGLDLLSLRNTEQVPPAHIERIFEAKKGTLKLETADRHWLYFIEACYD